jgi:hypothetical protein
MRGPSVPRGGDRCRTRRGSSSEVRHDPGKVVVTPTGVRRTRRNVATRRDLGLHRLAPEDELGHGAGLVLDPTEVEHTNVVCLDGDPPGLDRALAAGYRWVVESPSVRRLVVHPSRDPARAGCVDRTRGVDHCTPARHLGLVETDVRRTPEHGRLAGLAEVLRGDRLGNAGRDRAVLGPLADDQLVRRRSAVEVVVEHEGHLAVARCGDGAVRRTVDRRLSTGRDGAGELLGPAVGTVAVAVGIGIFRGVEQHRVRVVLVVGQSVEHPRERRAEADVVGEGDPVVDHGVVVRGLVVVARGGCPETTGRGGVTVGSDLGHVRAGGSCPTNDDDPRDQAGGGDANGEPSHRATSRVVWAQDIRLT